MKFFASIFLCILIPSSFAEVSHITATKESIGLLKEVASSDVAKEWGTKLGKQFSKISAISKKFGKYAGPAGEIISFALTIIGEQQEQTEEYLMNITKQLDKIDVKLDAISEQITVLDTKLTQSTKKIISEVKFRDYVQYFEELAASKQHFESIISSFTSNSTSLIIQLDKYIEDYRQKGSDTKLINILDSGAGISNSIVDDLIALTRSYYRDNFGSSGSSTMKTVYDVYLTAFMTVLKGNLILDSAVNIKQAITGNFYEDDRRYNHYRRNEIFKKFFDSLEKAFNKLDDNDMDGFIDFSITGDDNKVRMINVLQYFWENEDKLSIIDTCTDDCETFVNRKFSGGGCFGGVRDCKFGVSVHHTEKELRQSPQYDRIYLGYTLNHKWYGFGVDDESDPNMEQKKSYLRGFVNCHVCKCVCDQYSNSDSIRKIYAGKISAPVGFVITGIRFTEHNKAIYPQVQVGRLLPMATVDQKSVKWVDVPNDGNYVTFDFDKRDIGFGDPSLITFKNGVVTGVQLKSTYYGVSWSIYGRELLDFNRGLMGNELYIESPDSLSRVDTYDMIPGLSSRKQIFSIRKNIKIKFGISNEEKDAGQSFVPYFDGSKVSFDIKSPLSGITFIHYTNDGGYAGYIRPVIRSLDYRKLFKTSYEIEEFVLNANGSMNSNAVQQSLSNRIVPKIVLIFSFVCLLCR